MPQLQDEIVIPFRLDTGEADRILDQTRGRVASSAADMTRSVGRGENAIRSLKQEMSGAQRTANFFAGAVSSIIPATGLAGDAVRLLITGLVGGTGLGLALETVSFGIKIATDLHAEHKKKIEDSGKTLRSLTEAWGAYRDSLSVATGATAVFLKEHAKLSHEFLGSLRQFEEAAAEQERNVAILQGTGIPVLGDAVALYYRWAGGAREATEQTRKLANAVEVNRLALQEAQKAEQAPAAKRWLEAEKQARIEIWQKTKEVIREATLFEAGERQKVQLQLQYKIEDLRKHGADQAAVRAQIAAETRLANEKVRNIDIEERFRQGSLTEERMRSEAEEAAQTVLALQRVREEREKDVRLLEEHREELMLSQLGAATARYAQQAITSFSRLQQMRLTGLAGEKRGQELVMSGLDALGGAIQEFTKGSIEAMAKQAAVEGIINSAKALAALGLGFLGYEGGFAAAAAYGQAAALDFAVAGIAAGVAGVMSGGGGGDRGGPTGGAAGGGTVEGPPVGQQQERRAGPTINVFFSGQALMLEPDIKRYLSDLLSETRKSGW